MPISNQPGYEAGHFTRVYHDIIIPACDRAGFSADRADRDTSTNLIHLEIVKQVLNAPMAICDLSSRNPNVMFELGLRQAFDKPVVIIKDDKTPDIFDVGLLRYTSYRSSRIYHEVIEDQDAISAALRSTFDDSESGRGANTIIRLLGVEKAVVEAVDKGQLDAIALENLSSKMDAVLQFIRENDRSPRTFGSGRGIIVKRAISGEETSTYIRLTHEQTLTLESFRSMARSQQERVLAASGIPVKDFAIAARVFGLLGREAEEIADVAGVYGISVDRAVSISRAILNELPKHMDGPLSEHSKGT